MTDRRNHEKTLVNKSALVQSPAAHLAGPGVLRSTEMGDTSARFKTGNISSEE